MTNQKEALEADIQLLYRWIDKTSSAGEISNGEAIDAVTRLRQALQPKAVDVYDLRVGQPKSGSSELEWGYYDGWNDCIDRLHAQGRLQSAAWRDISTAPKDGTRVLLHRPNQQTKNDNGIMLGAIGIGCWVNHPDETGWCYFCDVFGRVEFSSPTHPRTRKAGWR